MNKLQQDFIDLCDKYPENSFFTFPGSLSLDDLIREFKKIKKEIKIGK